MCDDAASRSRPLNGAVEYVGEGFRVIQGTQSCIVVVRHLSHFEFWVDGNLT